MAESPTPRAARTGVAVDTAVALVLAIAAGYFAWMVTGLQDHIPILLDAKADDLWFEADVFRVFENMTSRFSDHHRSQVHPLFSLVGLEITHLFGSIPGVGKLAAVRMVIAAAAAAWLALFFGLLRTLRCRRLDAAVFSLVAATSAAFFFWTAIPETYLPGSLTIVIVLTTAAWSERRTIPLWAEVVVAATALSMLVTNFMFAVISLGLRYRLKTALQTAANGFVVVVALWAVQKYLVPSAHFFMGDHEKMSPVAALTVPRIFFLDTLVMPDISAIANDLPSLWPKLSIQRSSTWTLTPSGPIALAAWIALLAAGAWATATIRPLREFRLILGLSIAGQLLLHLVYGNESYLYALNWLPLLVTVAALTTFTRLRWFALAAAAVFIVTAAHHNYRELQFALDAVAAHGT